MALEEEKPFTGLPKKMIFAGVLALAVWWLAYRSLLPFAKWLTYRLFGLEEGTHLGSAVEFFLYDTPKVLLLLTLVVFAVGIVRSYFTADRARRMLAGKREAAGNVMAALLGIVTPFCSCSAVPLFIGFVTAGVPLGVTFSFLISAPMVNEIALVLLFGLFGWKIAALYLGTGLAIAMIAGWTIGRIGMERHVEPWVYEAIGAAGESGLDEIDSIRRARPAGSGRGEDIVGKVWIYIIIGIAVGAGIHGYVPENFMASFMGRGRVVVGAARRADRHPDVHQRRRDHPDRRGAARQGRGARHGARLHDGGDRPLAARDDHPAQGAAAAADRDLRRRRRRRDHDRRLPLQRGDVRQAVKIPQLPPANQASSNSRQSAFCPGNLETHIKVIA